MEYNTLGAVDLGSNSFHLAIGRVVDDQIYPLDSMKETVRLGSGLTPDKQLDGLAQDRAIAALRRFGERLKGMPREAVRVVGTNALRVAKNSGPFLRRASATLGFPIEVIPGREEARLIYLGVVHSLPMTDQNRLVVDIGGGSTEFIIGHKLRAKAMESLYMGCVSYTARFFSEGKVDKKSLRQAELAARGQVQTIGARFEKEGWREAVGSSGTARSIAEILLKNGQSQGGITASGLAWLRDELVAAGDFRKLALEGLREDRIPVVAGGVAIMSGVFAELGIAKMTVAEGALRDGVLWDLLGRVHHRDIRDVTIEQFTRRYHVDIAQAQRVDVLARSLLKGLEKKGELETVASFLDWAARLHEIGMSIAQGAYHKHSAYILANADMPGFSRQEQGYLSNLVLAQRGKLLKMRAAFDDDPRLAALALCLRLAVIFHRSRRSLKLPKLTLLREERGFTLSVEARWLEANGLVAAALEAEREQWDSVGLSFDFAGK
ncbi:MAG TPA: exopolyphosphatase [Usitatibacter sp.]|jgi:exopolyphosphatase/guanosine-5'-triphosphate,3'-diphosphate pyrophosphatase|nr:exopolyphosphatase [Usitatibacter sp.]